MAEPFVIYYYPDLLLQRGAAIVRATIPYDPVKRRHERRYQALADAQLVIERGRRYRRLLDRWTWDRSSSPHLVLHYPLDGAIRRAFGIPMKAPTVIHSRVGVPMGVHITYRAHNWIDPKASVSALIAAVDTFARQIAPAATIGQIAAEYQMRRVARSAARQGFPKPTVCVRRAAFAAVIAGGFKGAVDVLTGGAHREWVGRDTEGAPCLT